ncbi:MAG: AraC family ligand binding domain-containing protein, partial [Chloroflexi bacterium]|nr:AraC family ligand binding domain-containing protein [Chloroflexota bacterium]
PLPWPDTFVVGIVTSGSGSVTSTGGTLRLRAGESFALPAAAATDANLQADEALEVLFCLPPDPDALAGTGWQSRDAGPPS